MLRFQGKMIVDGLLDQLALKADRRNKGAVYLACAISGQNCSQMKIDKFRPRRFDPR
jgi:hypothetical protein